LDNKEREIVSWITDENGLGRQSRYVDLAESPPRLVKKRFFRFATELHRFQGQLCFVLTAKDLEFIDCGNSVTYGVSDQVSALISVGVQIGVARSWSRERIFPSGSCASCVPVLRLTDATLTETVFYGRGRKLPGITKRTLTQGPECERHYETDCVPRLDCPGCSKSGPIQPSDLSESLGGEASSEHTAVTLSVESAELASSDTESLLDESAAWLAEVLDSSEIDAAGGMFVQEHGRGLVFVPTDLDSAPAGLFPASALSIGRDIEQLGGIVIEPGESFPLVLLAPYSESASAWAGFVNRDDSDAVDVFGERAVLSEMRIGPFSLLVAAVSRDEAPDAAPMDLVMKVHDEATSRSQTLRFPLQDTMGELVPV
jgi:hypothetical protein